MEKSIAAREFLERFVSERPTFRKYKTKLLFDISSMIIDYRIERSLSQKQLAEILDVTQGMVSKWESGEYNFTIEQVCKIAEKLHLKPQIEFSKTGIFEESSWERNPRFITAKSMPSDAKYALIA